MLELLDAAASLPRLPLRKLIGDHGESDGSWRALAARASPSPLPSFGEPFSRESVTTTRRPMLPPVERRLAGG